MALFEEYLSLGGPVIDRFYCDASLITGTGWLYQAQERGGTETWPSAPDQVPSLLLFAMLPLELCLKQHFSYFLREFQLSFVSSSKCMEALKNVDCNLSYSHVLNGHLFYLLLSTSEDECALEGKSPLLGKFSSPTYQRHTEKNWVVWHEAKRWRSSFLPERSDGRGHCSFSGPLPHRSGNQTSYLSLYQSGQHYSPCSDDSLRPCLPNLQAQPTVFSGFSIQKACLDSWFDLS